MALSQGSVTVADDGTVTSSGLAKRFFDADMATLPLVTPPTLGSTSLPFSVAVPATADDIDAFNEANIKAKKEAARRANAYAKALFDALTIDASAKVDGVSLGKTPDPNDPNVAIAPPAAPVLLPIV